MAWSRRAVAARAGENSYSLDSVRTRNSEAAQFAKWSERGEKFPPTGNVLRLCRLSRVGGNASRDDAEWNAKK
jgi:hypothetical protein